MSNKYADGGIDDILAAATRNDGLIEGSDGLEVQDLQALTRAWITERSAPELMMWPGELMERCLGRISRQIQLVEDQTGNSDPKANLRLVIIQTELERFKFLVRSFLRARIAKIDAHSLHYLSLEPSPLSQSEISYAQNHTALLHNHYASSFLSQAPTSLQKMDDKGAGGVSMVEGPDVDTAVFVRCLRDMRAPVEVPGTEIRLALRMGEIVVTRWSAVKESVVSGDCELI